MRKRIIVILLTLLAGLPALAQLPVPLKEVIYQPGDADIINPERGFMSQLSHPPGETRRSGARRSAGEA